MVTTSTNLGPIPTDASPTTASIDSSTSSTTGRSSLSLYGYLAQIDPRPLLWYPVSKVCQATTMSLMQVCKVVSWGIDTGVYLTGNSANLEWLLHTGVRARLQEPRTQAMLASFLQQASQVADCVKGETTDDYHAAWEKTIELLSDPEHLHTANHLIHGLSKGHNVDRYLDQLPPEIQAFVNRHVVTEYLADLGKSGALQRCNNAINLLSERNQQRALSTVNWLPGFSKRALLKGVLVPFKQNPSSFNLTLPAERAAKLGIDPQTVRVDSERVLGVKSSVVTAFDEDQKDLIADQLMKFVAEIIHANRAVELDPDHLLAAHTQEIEVPMALRLSRLSEVVKRNLPLFEMLLVQPNLQVELDDILTRAEMPASARQLLEPILRAPNVEPQELTDLNSLIPVAVNLFRNAGHLVPAEMKDRVVDNVVNEALSQQIDAMMNGIKPYEEVPFYRTFVDELLGSLPDGPIKEVGRLLGLYYFPAMDKFPEDQRKLAYEALKHGKYADMLERLVSVLLVLGPGYLKSFQVYNKVKHDTVKQALKMVKDQIRPMPFAKALNTIEEGFAQLNAGGDAEHRRFSHIYSANGAPTVEPSLKAATIGQVHKAEIRVDHENNRSEIAKVALKVRRDGIEQRAGREREAIMQAIAVAEAALQRAQEGGEAEPGDEMIADLNITPAFFQAVKFTLETLMLGVEKEIDFPGHELKNGQIAHRVYRGEKDGIRLTTPVSLAATENVIVQTWAENGESVNSLWEDLDQQTDHLVARLDRINGMTDLQLRDRLIQFETSIRRIGDTAFNDLLYGTLQEVEIQLNDAREILSQLDDLKTVRTDGFDQAITDFSEAVQASFAELDAQLAQFKLPSPTVAEAFDIPPALPEMMNALFEQFVTGLHDLQHRRDAELRGAVSNVKGQLMAAYQDKITLLQEMSSIRAMESTVWMSAVLKHNYLDSDRHDGNELYDQLNKIFYMLDFGAGIETTEDQKNHILGLMTGVLTHSPDAIYDHLRVLTAEESGLPFPPRSELVPEFRHALQKRSARERMEEVRDLMVDREQWPETLTVEHLLTGTDQVAGLSPADTNRLLYGHAKGRSLTRVMRESTLDEVRLQTLNRVLAQHGVPEWDAKRQALLRKAVTNPNHVAYNSLLQYKNIGTDNFHQLYLVKTLTRVTEVVLDRGLPAPEVFLALLRGITCLTDKMELNNERIRQTREAVEQQFPLATNDHTAAALHREAAELKIRDVSYQIAKAVATNAPVAFTKQFGGSLVKKVSRPFSAKS